MDHILADCLARLPLASCSWHAHLSAHRLTRMSWYTLLPACILLPEPRPTVVQGSAPPAEAQPPGWGFAGGRCIMRSCAGRSEHVLSVVDPPRTPAGSSTQPTLCTLVVPGGRRGVQVAGGDAAAAILARRSLACCLSSRRSKVLGGFLAVSDTGGLPAGHTQGAPAEVTAAASAAPATDAAAPGPPQAAACSGWHEAQPPTPAPASTAQHSGSTCCAYHFLDE